MHRSRTADALLEQIVAEKAVDVVLISEQYGGTSRTDWLEDETRTAAIWIPGGNRIRALASGSGPGFAYIKTSRFSLVSCYLTPSDPIQQFQVKLDLIEDTALEIGGSLIIAGDFNSRAAEWGMSSTNSRGRRVLDMAARLGLVVANTGLGATFRRPGCTDTTPDITLVSESIFQDLKEWKVLEEFTGSDHQYITFRMVEGESVHRGARGRGTRKWNVSKLNPEALLAAIDENVGQLNADETDLSLVGATMACIERGCNASMPKMSKGTGRTSVYWWSDEIAELRRKCLQRRRRLTRARRNSDALEEAEEFRRAKKELKVAIARSKKAKWEELRNDLNSDPWGLGYKTVMRKLGAKASMPELDSATMTGIVKTLFPAHELRVYDDEMQPANFTPPRFTVEELQNAARNLKSNKAPGPDGIPSEVLKLIARERPMLLLNMYNMCLCRGVFPTRWKKQRLVLISKGKGDPSQASAYRPLCMLDSAGKLYERLLKPRINKAVEEAGGLSERQYGFRAGRSTIKAVMEVVNSVNATRRGNHFSRRMVLLATLDVRNAFNSLRWVDVLGALRNRFAVPVYLLKILQSYLSDRELLYDTIEGQRRMRITSGAAQGSILGPDLWNITYDDIFRIEMPDDTYLVGYADDVAAVIEARNEEEARRKLNQVIIRTRSWLDDRGLRLATEKTEVILLTRKHIPMEIDMPIADTILTTKKVVKYLGIRMDPKLTFRAQLQHSATKAARVAGLLSKLMANIGGPTQGRRKLLMAVTNSILLYGSEVWADALRIGCRRRLISAIQRNAALRISSAYRTVSGPAVMVISGEIPIDLQASERKRLWEAKNIHGQSVSADEERKKTLQSWQQRWNSEPRGRWTSKLIPNITQWVERKFGEVNYYLTQLLSGHGYFCAYLWRMGKIEEPGCIYGDAESDDAEHTFFYCAKWCPERSRIESKIGPLTVENFCWRILESEENWDTIARFSELVLRSKKADLDERLRRGE